MIITEYNNMTLEELNALSYYMKIGYVIEDGKIVGAEEMPIAELDLQ